MSIQPLVPGETPLLVYPSVAKRFGDSEAVFLSQLHYNLMTLPGKIIAGTKWIYRTLDEWGRELRHMTRNTIRRIIQKLTTQGIIQIANHGGGRTTWYTIDQGALVAKLAEGQPNRKPRSDYPNFGYWAKERRESKGETLGSSKIRTNDDPTLGSSNIPTLDKSLYIETPSEIPTETPFLGADAPRADEVETEEILVNPKLALPEPPDSYQYRYASHRGTTAHLIRGNEWKTACGEPTTHLLSDPRSGAEYQVCERCWQIANPTPPSSAAPPPQKLDKVTWLTAGGWGGGETIHVTGRVLASTPKRITIVVFNEKAQKVEEKHVTPDKLLPRDTDLPVDAALLAYCNRGERIIQPHIAIIDAYYAALPADVRPPGDPVYERHARAACDLRDAGITPQQVADYVKETYSTYRAWAVKFGRPALMSLEHIKTYIKAWLAKLNNPEAPAQEFPKRSENERGAPDLPAPTFNKALARMHEKDQKP